MKFEDIDFITSEHAYQWSACVEQLRDDLAEKVIKSKTPHEAKYIASPVKSPDSNWHSIKYEVMERVLHEKAHCSEEFRNELISTGTKLLIEPRQDMWWGSGLSYQMTSTTMPSHHPGKSWLGEILMKIRSKLTSLDAPIETKTTKSSTEVTPADASNITLETHTQRGRLVTSQYGSKKRSRSYENKIRSTSISPSRSTPLKSKKFDTPLLKDFLRKQVKQTLTHTDPTVTTSCHVPPTTSAQNDAKRIDISIS